MLAAPPADFVRLHRQCLGIACFGVLAIERLAGA
jgi:hypothetical protein